MRLRGYDGELLPPALICCRASATARCRNDGEPNGRGEGQVGGAKEIPRGLGLAPARSRVGWVKEPASAGLWNRQVN